MPVNPLLSLQVQTPDIGKSFSNALLNVQRLSQIQQAQEARPSKQAKFTQRQGEIITSLGIAGQQIIPDLTRGRPQDLENVAKTLNLRRTQLESQGLPTDETDDAIALLQSSPAELLTRSQQAVELAQQVRTQTTGAKTQFGGQQTFKDGKGNLFFGTTKRNPSTGAIESVLAPIGDAPQTPIGGVSLVSPLGETAAEQVRSEAEKAGLKEQEKQKAKLKFGPQISTAVTKARKAAEERGDVFNELSHAKAALPGLTNAIDQLRELATIATSTLGGRVFDVAVKETGFGSTKGATAKAKFIAIVNNQVLPLLKPTFGAAFTVQEGESLKKTMGDPDATPAEKMVQLDAFIDQKIRDIETKERQLQPGATPATPATLSGQQDLSTLSTEQLLKMRQQAQ